MIGGVTLGSFGTPAINNSGTVAFTGLGVFTLRPTALLAKQEDIIGGVTLNTLTVSAINNGGTVAVQSLTGAPSGDIYFTLNPTAVVAKPGDTIGGETLTQFPTFRGFAINDSGTMAFFSAFSGGTGIFTKSAVLAKTGDTIGGKTLTDVRQRGVPALGTPRAGWNHTKFVLH